MSEPKISRYQAALRKYGPKCDICGGIALQLVRGPQAYGDLVCGKESCLADYKGMTLEFLPFVDVLMMVGEASTEPELVSTLPTGKNRA